MALPKKYEFSERLCLALVTWAAILVCGTEVLSLFEILTTRNLYIYWGIIAFVGVSIWGLFGSKVTLELKEEKRFALIFFIPFMLVIYRSLKMVPCNWDSMTYHLARVAHWEQNKTVNHYATNIVRQITSPVLYEYILLNVKLLSNGKDIFVNLIQSISFFVNGFLIFEICRKMKLRLVYCYIATLIWLSTPICLAESLTTQNDHLATLWMLIFLFFVLDFLYLYNGEDVFNNRLKVIILGNCVAFGYLTKPSVSIQMLLIAIWLFAIWIRERRSIKDALQYVLVAFPFIVLPIVPSLIRNYISFNAFSDPIAGKKQLIGTLEPRYIFVNFLKNFCFNLPNTYDIFSALKIRNFVMHIADLVGVNIDNPAISENGNSYYVRLSNDFDSATNFTIIILFIISCFILLCQWKHLEQFYREYSLVTILCVLVFFSLLRWEGYISRYMLSYFAMISIFFCIQLQNVKWNSAVRVMAVIVILYMTLSEGSEEVEYLTDFVNRQGIIRDYSYFSCRTELYIPYRRAVNYIEKKEYRNVGIKCSEDSYEYPLFAMFDSDIRIEHVLVENNSSRYLPTDFLPECIVLISKQPEEEFEYLGNKYILACESGRNVYVYDWVKY